MTKQSVPRRSRSWWQRAVLSLILAGVSLLLGMSAFDWLSSFKQEPPRQTESAIRKTYSVTVFEAQPADLQRVISAFGTAQADREVVLAAEVAGRIVEADRLQIGRRVSAANVSAGPEGQSVRSSGDLLVRIDPHTYEERVIQAKKMVSQDDVELERLAQEQKNNQRLLETEQDNLKTATTEFENMQRLKQQGVGTDSAVRRAELEMRRYVDAVTRLENEIGLYDVRRQQILSRQDAHQSDLELAQLELARTEVRPPFSGVLSEVFVEEGQYVRPGDTLVRLTDPTRVEVPLSLPLSDYFEISAVRESGKPVRVALAENESAPPRWFSDPLNELRQAPEADERTRTVKVYTEVDNTAYDVPLLPGTFLHARLLGTVRKGVIAVPRDAVIDGTVFVAVPDASEKFDPLTGPPTAWTARVERRAVTVGMTLQSLVMIESGLEAGEWIVMSNLDVIFEGAELKIEGEDSQRRLADELSRLRTPQVRIVNAE